MKFRSLLIVAASLGVWLLPLLTQAQEWTTFGAGTLNGFSFTHAHHPDGRYLFGLSGQVSVQDDFTLPAFTAVSNPDSRAFDPSFIAVRSASEALIGGGGFFAPTPLFPFDPSQPATPIGAGLATTNNYAAVFWAHPTSGREGWLIVGSNGPGGSNNLTFFSPDGLTTGPVTGTLSAFSGGLAVDAAGNIAVALADLDPNLDNLIVTFTADQIDTAVAAILASSPEPLAFAAAAQPFQADASGVLAVDALGRFWVGGYQINHLQAFDPATGVTRRFRPDHAPLPNATGPPTYAPRAFSRAGVDYVSFLANDSFYTAGSGLALGHKPVSELELRSVQFTSAGQSAHEHEGTILVRVTITPAPDQPVTVPVLIGGTATSGADFTVPTEVLFGVGDTEKDIPVALLNDARGKEGTETVVLTLGEPVPAREAGLGALDSETFTLQLLDDDVAPTITVSQAFAPVQVGSGFSHTVQLTGPVAATRWRATGLPPGLKIDPRTGVISGRPTRPGEYANVVIHASNAFGTTVSVAYVFQVAALPEAAVGRFFGLLDRTGPETGGLGARLDLTTSSNGAWSGRLLIGKKAYKLRGALDSSSGQPAFTATFRHLGATYTLDGLIDPVTGALSGGVQGGSQLTGHRASPSARTGASHFFAAVPGGPAPTVPEGTSFGQVRFGKKATVSIVGRLADGSAYISAGTIGSQGEVLVYTPLYRAPGSVAGFLTVAADAEQEVTGQLTWSKPAQAKGSYPAGWAVPLTLDAVGGKYRPVAGATLPLDAAATGLVNASLTLQDGGIDQLGANPRLFDVTVLSAKRLVIAAPHKLALNNASGAFSGALLLDDGGVRRRATLAGLLVPNPASPSPFDTAGYGYFLFTDGSGITRSGMVLLEPVP